MKLLSFLFLVLMLVLVVAKKPASPFSRTLAYDADTPMTGRDVKALQFMLNRWTELRPNLEISGVYDSDTAEYVRLFKQRHDLDYFNSDFHPEAAKLVFDLYSEDKLKYNGKTADEYGRLLGLDLKYLIHIPAHTDRSIETEAKLMDRKGNVVMTFIARTHGHSGEGAEPWPTFSDTAGMSEFGLNGNTPTGVSLIDYQTPEPVEYEDWYGPYNVQRLVQGIEGNSMISPGLRSGILIHTGNWHKAGWTTDKPMPDSAGCVHIHPEDLKQMEKHMADLGVEARENTLGKLPYPYIPQGIMVVELVD